MTDVTRLLIGQFASRLGDQMAAVGLAYLAVETVSGESGAADILLFKYLPFLFIGPLVTLVIDRLPRRGAMVMSDLFRFVATAVMVICYAEGDLNKWLMASLLFLITVATNVFDPLRDAWLPDLGDPKDLIRNNSWLRLSETLAMVFGPMIAGFLLSFADDLGQRPLVVLFWVDAFSYLVSMLFLMNLPKSQAAAQHSRPREEWRRFMKILKDPIWRKVVIITVINNMGIMGPALFAKPLLVKETLVWQNLTLPGC